MFLFSAIDPEGRIINNEALAGIQNAGWIWVPLLIVSAIAAFIGMNNVITGTPKLPGTIQGIGKSLYMISLGLIAAGIGAYLLVRLEFSV